MKSIWIFTLSLMIANPPSCSAFVHTPLRGHSATFLALSGNYQNGLNPSSIPPDRIDQKKYSSHPDASSITEKKSESIDATISVDTYLSNLEPGPATDLTVSNTIVTESKEKAMSSGNRYLKLNVDYSERLRAASRGSDQKNNLLRNTPLKVKSERVTYPTATTVSETSIPDTTEPAPFPTSLEPELITDPSVSTADVTETKEQAPSSGNKYLKLNAPYLKNVRRASGIESRGSDQKNQPFLDVPFDMKSERVIYPRTKVLNVSEYPKENKNEVLKTLEDAEASEKEVAEKNAEDEKKIKEKEMDEMKVKAKSEAEARAKVEVKVEAEAKAKSEVEVKVKDETKAEAKAKSEAEVKVKAEAKAKSEDEAKAKSEEEVKARSEAEVKVKAEAKAKSEAEAKAKSKAESKAKSEAEVKAFEAQVKAEVKVKAEAKTKSEAEMRVKAETKTEAEAKAKSEAEVKAKAEAKAKSEAEVKIKAEAKAKSEAEVKAKAEKQVKVKAKSEPESLLQHLGVFFSNFSR